MGVANATHVLWRVPDHVTVDWAIGGMGDSPMATHYTCIHCVHGTCITNALR